MHVNSSGGRAPGTQRPPFPPQVLSSSHRQLSSTSTPTPTRRNRRPRSHAFHPPAPVRVSPHVTTVSKPNESEGNHRKDQPLVTKGKRRRGWIWMAYGWDAGCPARARCALLSGPSSSALCSQTLRPSHARSRPGTTGRSSAGAKLTTTPRARARRLLPCS